MTEKKSLKEKKRLLIGHKTQGCGHISELLSLKYHKIVQVHAKGLMLRITVTLTYVRTTYCNAKTDFTVHGLACMCKVRRYERYL